jgi:hypothetical protein
MPFARIIRPSFRLARSSSVPGHFDHFQHGDAGIGRQHRRELSRAARVGHPDQRGAAAIQHPERAERWRYPAGSRRFHPDKAFRAAVLTDFDDLDRFLDHHDLVRRRRQGEREQGQDQKSEAAHGHSIAPRACGNAKEAG